VDTDDYRWFEFVECRLPERFPRDWPWLAGAEQWAEGLGALREPSAEGVRLWLERIRRAPKKKAALCPRVFVSHRQADGAAALRLAWLAQNGGLGLLARYHRSRVDAGAAHRVEGVARPVAHSVANRNLHRRTH
jgi:hypothetical protein